MKDGHHSRRDEAPPLLMLALFALILLGLSVAAWALLFN